MKALINTADKKGATMELQTPSWPDKASRALAVVVQQEGGVKGGICTPGF